MRKMVYFIAEDGTQFGDEWECERYEERLRIQEVFEPFSCYDRDGCLLDTDGENFNPDDVCYILVKEDSYENGSYMNLDYFIYNGRLPALIDVFKDTDTTLIYLNPNSDTWENWHKEFSRLTEIKEMFQLFAGKGE
jgi:hypothetical protein